MPCGLTGFSPANITSPETIQDEHSFITSLSSAVALPIPGRLANFKDERDWTAFCRSSLDLSDITTYHHFCRPRDKPFVCLLFVCFLRELVTAPENIQNNFLHDLSITPVCPSLDRLMSLRLVSDVQLRTFT